MREDEESRSHRDFLESFPHSLESTLLRVFKITLCYYRPKAFQTIHSFVHQIFIGDFLYLKCSLKINNRLSHLKKVG